MDYQTLQKANGAGCEDYDDDAQSKKLYGHEGRKPHRSSEDIEGCSFRKQHMRPEPHRQVQYDTYHRSRDTRQCRGELFVSSELLNVGGTQKDEDETRKKVK